MDNFITGAIANVATAVKSFRLRQTLIALFGVLFLFTTTACGTKAVATTPGTYDAANQPRNSASKYGQDVGGLNRELYKPIQQKAGGMNNYNDDPRYDKGASQDKVEKLMNRAERNLQKRAENPQELVDNVREQPVGEKVRGFTNKVGDATERLKNNVSRDTEATLRDMREGAESIRQDAPRIANEAQQNAKGAAKGVLGGVKDLTEPTDRVRDKA